MAGKIRTEPYPSIRYDGPGYSGPMVPGLTRAGSDAYNNPAIPNTPGAQQYGTWTDYVKAVLAGQVPNYNSESQGPLADLIGQYGYDRLAHVLDTQDPQIQGFLDNTYYSNTSYDEFSPWGDNLFPVLAGLGIVGGASALAPALGGAAGVGAEAGLEAGAATGFAGAADTVGLGATEAAGGALAATPGTLAPVAAEGGGGFLAGLGTAGKIASGVSSVASLGKAALGGGGAQEAPAPELAEVPGGAAPQADPNGLQALIKQLLDNQANTGAAAPAAASTPTAPVTASTTPPTSPTPTSDPTQQRQDLARQLRQSRADSQASGLAGIAPSYLANLTALSAGYPQSQSDVLALLSEQYGGIT